MIYNFNDGRVGLGTSSPVARFQILANSYPTAKLHVEAPASATIPALKVASQGSLANNDIIRAQIDGLTAGFRMFQDAGSNVRYTFENGNVGIRTVAPTQPLEVAGTIYSTSGGFKFPDGSTQTSAAVGGGDPTVARTNVNNNFTSTQTITGSLLVSGNASFGGTITKGAGSFKIDHPLDPSGKYLSHSFVESPDMKNVYDGVVVLDAHGEAWVQLPDYFSALNRDFRYQLTALGRPAPNLFVAEEMTGNRFKIAGGGANARVSWQVTGTRQDAYANAHRIPVVEEKTGAEQGTYIHPELYESAAPGPKSAHGEKQDLGRQKGGTH